MTEKGSGGERLDVTRETRVSLLPMLCANAALNKTAAFLCLATTNVVFYLTTELARLQPATISPSLTPLMLHAAVLVGGAVILPKLLADANGSVPIDGGEDVEPARRSITGGRVFLALLLLLAAVVRIFELTVRPESLAWQSAASAGLALFSVFAYCHFFAIAPFRNRGLLFGLSLVPGVAAKVLFANASSSLEPAAARQWCVYLIIAGTSFVAAAQLFSIVRFPCRPFLADTQAIDRQAQGKTPTLWLLAMLALFFVINSLQYGRLFPFIMPGGVEHRFGPLPFLLVVLITALGYVLDRNPTTWFRRTLPACAVVFMLVTALPFLDGSPWLFMVIHTAAVVGQFAVFLAVTLAVARLAPFGRWWGLAMCAPLALRLLSVPLLLVVRRLPSIDTGHMIVLSIAAALMFYHVARRIAARLAPECIFADAGEKNGAAAKFAVAPSKSAYDRKVLQSPATPVVLTARQKLQPVLAILGFYAVHVAAAASFMLRPNAEQRIGPIIFGSMLGLLFGVAALPAIMRWNRRGKAMPFSPYGILLRAPLLLLCLNYLPVFLLGYETWLQDNASRYISNFALFAMYPLAYHVYFSRMPAGSRGLWLSIAVVMELIVWRVIARVAEQMGAVVPGTTHPMMPYVFWGFMVVVGWVTAVLLYTFFFRDAKNPTESTPTENAVFPEMEEKTARNRIAMIIAAAICMYAVSGVADIKAAPSLTLMTFPYALGGLRLFALLAIPLAAWSMDRKPLPAFRAISLACGGLFIFAPVLTVLRDIPVMLWSIATLVELAQYVAVFTFCMALGGVVRSEDGVRRWPAILIVTRLARETCYWLFHIKMAIPTGLAVLLGTAFAFAFLVLTYFISRPAAETVKQNGVTKDYNGFLESRKLTGRQRQVALLLLRGLSTREMAEALGIAEPTVKFHVRKTLEKFGCTTRNAFISKCLEEMGTQE